MKTISPKDLYRRLKLGHNAVLLDIRPPSEYEENHIIGALSCPFISFQAEAIISTVCAAYATPPTLYLISASNHEADEAYQHLEKAGYEYITKLEGGMQAWVATRLPLKETREKAPLFSPLPIEQQIYIGMGSLVALGTLLGTFFNTAFLAIPLLVGVGLAYDGLFRTGYLKQTLLKMPWNRRASL